MRRLLGPLDRYVFAEFLQVFVPTTVCLPVLVFVMELMQELHRYLDRKVPWRDVALSYVYWIPETVFNVLPAATLFATVFTVGAVTRHSEITAAKASGISFYRFILPIVLGAALATGLGLGLGEVAPRWSARRLELIRDRTSARDSTRATFAYASERGLVYKAARLHLDSGRLTTVEIERRGTGPAYPSQLTAAPSATWRAGRGWTIDRGTLHVLPYATTDLAFRFDSLVDRRMTERPRDLMVAPRTPEDMNYEELGRYIAAQARSGVNVDRLRVERMLKIAVPATCVIILLFGAPLATSTQRGGAAFGVGLSLGTTIIFLTLIQLTKAVGGKGLVTPELAAWIPSVLFGVVGLVLLARTRT